MKPKLDCRHFRGDKPCCFARGGTFRCEACGDYQPMGRRILIIKLDAIGDVARTTCLLPALGEKHRPLHLTWLTAPEAAELLHGNPLVDVVLPYEVASLERLRVEKFDLVLSLDKTPQACAIAELAQAPQKRGFGLSVYGSVYPLDKNAEYAFELGLSDELKFRRNTRTYQDVIFELAGLKFSGEDYCLPLDEESRAFAGAWCESRPLGGIGAGDTVIGLNLGGGGAFANKMWDAERCIEFVALLRKRRAEGWVLLFGAEREKERMAQVAAAGGERAAATGTSNSLRQFQALLGRCSVVVTGDTLGMHLALAEKRPVVALFGPTCPQEIELYGRGEKVVSPLDCRPCYQSQCQRSPSCMAAIPAQAVLEAVMRHLPQDHPLPPKRSRQSARR